VSAIDYVSGYLMAFGAMVALERRAREGGSWRVSVALARTGKWIVDRGLVPQAGYSGLPDDLPKALLQPLFVECDAPDGRIRHLGPIVALSETPGRWSRPPVPLGTHAPVWPPR
jgi:crotonobetainyl-CoA:carnitine CoA-transferase CaiB-like acyl-CoA transferase